MLDEIWQVLEERKRQPETGSYTVELLAGGQDLILRKIHEETVELTLAAVSEGRQRMTEEVADLFYHVLVLLLASGVDLSDVWAELRARRSGPKAGVSAKDES